MEIKQLIYFIEITNQGSFSRASEILGISQPSLSLQIKRLEEELGTPLFHRLGRGIRPTQAGNALLRHGYSALASISDAKKEINELLNIECGSLSVGSVQSVNTYFIPPVVVEFHKKYPKVKLNIQENSAPRLEQMLRDGELDIVFSFSPASLDEIYADPLFKEYLILATGSHHKLASRKKVKLSELENYPFALFNSRLKTRKLIDEAFEKTGIEPNVVLEMNTMDGLLRSVSNSELITLVPERGALHHEDICCIQIETPRAYRQIGVLRRQGTYKSAASLAFEKIMYEQNRI